MVKAAGGFDKSQFAMLPMKKWLTPALNQQRHCGPATKFLYLVQQFSPSSQSSTRFFCGCLKAEVGLQQL
jgi:hypothetical protein